MILAGVFGVATAAFLPRLAHRLAVAAGSPGRTACGTCGASLSRWVRVGASCRCFLLALIDLRCLRLPDRLVGLLLAVAGVPLAVLLPARIGPALLAAALVGGAYLAIALLPRGGLGLGDVKLAAVLAVILGFASWPAVIVGLVAPHLINGPIALALLLTGRADRRRPLPFGPALLAGALVALVTTA